MFSWQNSLKITILGAGLLGRLLAFKLASEGHKIEIFEKNNSLGLGTASRVAAAMLAPLSESVTSEENIVKMGRYSLSAWTSILEDLTKNNQQKVYFQQNGSIIVWHYQDKNEANRIYKILQENSKKFEIEGLVLVENEALGELEPSLKPKFFSGIYIPVEGHLDNRQLMSVLLENLKNSQNVKINWQSPKDLKDFSVFSKNDSDLILDCRGFGVKQDWSDIRGVRGEILRIYAPEVSLNRPTRVLHPRYPIYIVPKENNIFVIGATQIETSDLGPATIQSTMELMSALYSINSAFADAQILEIEVANRPALINNAPALRWFNDKTLQINGLYRHGFMIAPAIIDATLEYLKTGKDNLINQFKLPIFRI